MPARLCPRSLRPDPARPRSGLRSSVPTLAHTRPHLLPIIVHARLDSSPRARVRPYPRPLFAPTCCCLSAFSVLVGRVCVPGCCPSCSWSVCPLVCTSIHALACLCPHLSVPSCPRPPQNTVLSGLTMRWWSPRVLACVCHAHPYRSRRIFACPSALLSCPSVYLPACTRAARSNPAGARAREPCSKKISSAVSFYADSGANQPLLELGDSVALLAWCGRSSSIGSDWLLPATEGDR
ncbi:uncharacterized protein C8Q71DRAFT_480415 [Rhodofomes roseus]|uniref:Uncharacterized protein n=1 Tax=Rhodofomes roseus TaxID=34475 RepID=A0ABQ8KP43_9APHY|nr:uncharacterized protein C8Q71DRAFT_480415 [Rhodofomes roseus]KAH9840180.1 hypothetical protein C8Q71DRAFT_480415 [Rhodofomes roseus]